MTPTLYTAVHEIHFRDDDGPRVVSPGELFEPLAADVRTFLDTGAIREPTETEAQVYALTKPRKANAASTDEIK